MQAQTEWYFDVLSSFEITCRHIPTLLETTRRLTFQRRIEGTFKDNSIVEDRGDIFKNIVTSLGQSHNLEYLCLSRFVGPVPLNLIEVHLAQLESLEIEVYNLYDREMYSGSLVDCKHLTTLSIVEKPSHGQPGREAPTPRSGFLPLGSVHSLTTLSLTFHQISAHNIESLHQFVNLKHLRLGYLESNVCTTLAAVKTFSLETFATAMDESQDSRQYVQYDQIVSLLCSPCLRNIRCLDFSIDPLFSCERDFLSIIAQNLRELETLTMGLPLDDQWSTKLRQLSKLRHVYWSSEIGRNDFHLMAFVCPSVEDIFIFENKGMDVFRIRGGNKVHEAVTMIFPGNPGKTEVQLDVLCKVPEVDPYEGYYESYLSEDDSDVIVYQDSVGYTVDTDEFDVGP